MLINFNCPSCGAALVYDIKLGKMHCDHCGYSEAIKPDDEDAQGNEGAQSKDSETAGETMCCMNCGGVVQVSDKTCSTRCEYCDTPLVVADRLSGKWRPASVLPFKLDRKSAEGAFRKWCHNGHFTPKGFLSSDNMAKLQPTYIPYYLYDMDATVDVSGTATRVRVYVHGETEFTETDFFNVRRRMQLEYAKVPYDASEKMDDTLMAKLQPYHFEDLTTFEMPYLSGFPADQADYEPKELQPLVEHQVHDYAVDYARGTISGYTGVNLHHEDVSYNRVTQDYVYLPAWFISYKYQNKDYIFAMNGQTGKVIGEPPVSKGKIAMWFVGISAIVFAILMVIGGLF